MIKHLQTQHDAVVTKVYTSLKQKEEDFVALITKGEEYKYICALLNSKD